MIAYPQKESYTIDDLIDIVAILRSENGCPWDMEQTHASIRMDFIEEVYEAIEAIDLQDTALLREELGDVLLQVVFHCQIEREQNTFTFDDICNELCQKLIIRHPHVFNSTLVSGTGEVLKNWDAIKKETKGQKTYTETLESIAKSLPALMRAQKVGKRAERAGMDFRCKEEAIAGITDEKNELEEAIIMGRTDQIEDEMGDLLFSCVNAARHLGIDAEQALAKATDKFIRRFAYTEQLVTEDQNNMPDLPISELNKYWDKAKQLEEKQADATR